MCIGINGRTTHMVLEVFSSPLKIDTEIGMDSYFFEEKNAFLKTPKS